MDPGDYEHITHASIDMRNFIRRWIPLLYLLPLAYMLRPILWTPIDYRFYNYFHAKRQVPPWTEVVVVGIDEKTTEEIWTAPVYPFSQHIESHAVVTKRLDEAGARAIVFDLAFTPELIGAEPVALAEAFRSSGMVYLTMTVREEWQTTNGGEELIGLRGVTPHELLVGAARGVYVADVTIDPDGYLRRFSADPRLAELGLETLPEHLAGVRVHRDVPIEFPSVENPVPLVSYRDILAGDTRALEQCAGRIVFVGSIIDQTDFITVPRLQILPQGHNSFRLPGVAALAAITENLLALTHARYAGHFIDFVWILLWSLIVVSIMPKKHPAFSLFYLAVIAILSIALTALLHVFAGFILPYGFLLGALFIVGTFTIVKLYIQTICEHEQETKEQEIKQRLLEVDLEYKAKELEKAEQLKIAHEKLEKAHEELKQTQIKLVQSEKMASLSKLVAGIAHEINNPIGAMHSMHTTLMKAIEKMQSAMDEKAKDQQYTKLFRVIEDANDVIISGNERITTIVKKLKNFAKLDQADLQTCDIREGIDDTLKMLEHQINDNIEIVKDYGDIPHLTCYPRQLNQAFLNLILNASEAIPNSGTITIKTYANDNKVHISITDTGIGITPENLDKIFDPGFTTKGVSVGTGLGLSICYNILSLHKGTITVESESGKGSTFTISLPVDLGKEIPKQSPYL